MGFLLNQHQLFFAGCPFYLAGLSFGPKCQDMSRFVFFKSKINRCGLKRGMASTKNSFIILEIRFKSVKE